MTLPPSTGRSARGAWEIAACLGASLAVLLVLHGSRLGVPYHWDELYFAPWAADVYSGRDLLPAVGQVNPHPPLVPLVLSGVWRVFGFSPGVARVAMLAVAASTVAATYALARRLAGRVAAAFAAAAFLSGAVFLTHAPFVLLDVTAALLALLAVHAGLSDRPLAAGLLSTALVLAKQTGFVVPAVLALAPPRTPGRLARIAALPALACVAWLSYVRAKTGGWFGDPEFAAYNVTSSLRARPVTDALVARLDHLFLAHGQIILSALVVWGLFRGSFRAPGWRVLAAVALAYVLLHAVVGGALLARYLLPVIALLGVAAGAAVAGLPFRARLPVAAASLLVLVVGAVRGGDFAWPDFVAVSSDGARWLEERAPDRTIRTALPLTDAFTRPAGGYVSRQLSVRALRDFDPATLAALDLGRDEVVVVFPRRPGDRPDASLPPGLRRLARFERGEKWLEIHERADLVPP